MGRSRFVQPGRVRLLLADVHTRALHELRTKGKDVGDGKYEKATADDIAAAEAAVAQAIDDGDWIEVKSELNAGETRRIFTDLVKDLHAGEKAALDPEQVGLTKMLQYILAWSFVDQDGRPEPFSASALENLDTDSYREVSAAVDWHDEQVEAKRQERKNGRTSGSMSSVISMSVAG